jgi:hypothetical protein
MNQVIISFKHMYGALTKEEIEAFIRSLDKINQYKRVQIKNTLDKLENKEKVNRGE